MAIKTKCVGSLLFFVCAAQLPAQKSAAPASVNRSVDEYINAQMHATGTPGLSLAVIKDGKVIEARGYGLANVETNTAATTETVYKIGSMSKQFLAAAIMVLVQDGKLRVDDSIAAYIEGVPQAWKQISVRQLLTHTSGIVRDPPIFDPLKVQADSEVLRSAFEVPLEFTPGSKWDYSNTNYYALAEIIRKVSGRPWSEFITQRILAPSGMTHTRTTTESEIVPHRAAGYSRTANRLVNADVWFALRPSGAFLSTVEDLAKWDAELNSETVLTASSREQMWSPVKLNDGTTYPYGFGWFVDVVQHHRRIHHDGALPGFKSDIERYPDDKLTVIVLANSGTANAEKIATHVAGLYVPAVIPPLEPAIADTSPQITAHVKAMIDGFITGKLDMSLFAPNTAARIDDEMKARWREILVTPGKLQAISLVERKTAGKNQQSRYRVDYRFDSFFLICNVDPSGKIVGFGVDD